MMAPRQRDMLHDDMAGRTNDENMVTVYKEDDTLSDFL
jgi:hypothetical protein